MADDSDPPFVRNLLAQGTDHNVYFRVGNPTQGDVERIGAVSAMLMAHSLVMRRVLSIQDTDLLERWDIPVTNIQPKVFKNMLRFIYGYNNIKSCSVVEAMQMLKLADSLVMYPLMTETMKYIKTILTPITVCQILKEPACLHNTRFESEVTKAIKESPKQVLTSPDLHLVAPAAMRYLMKHECYLNCPTAVWRAVMKWARQRVLKEDLLSSSKNSRLDQFLQPSLFVPDQSLMSSCALNLIQLVEEAGFNHESVNEIARIISRYHIVHGNPAKRLYVCNSCDKDGRLTHEPLQVKMFNSSYLWKDAVYTTESELLITTSDSRVDLFSIVCTGRQKIVENVSIIHPEELLAKVPEEALASLKVELDEEKEDRYEVKGTVKVSLLIETQKNIKINPIVFRSDFHNVVTFSEDFQMRSEVTLEANSNYKLTINFLSKQPLWKVFDNDNASPTSSHSLEVQCGPISKDSRWNGSHVKYLAYKTVKEEKD